MSYYVELLWQWGHHCQIVKIHTYTQYPIQIDLHGTLPTQIASTLHLIACVLGCVYKEGITVVFCCLFTRPSFLSQLPNVVFKTYSLLLITKCQNRSKQSNACILCEKRTNSPQINCPWWLYRHKTCWLSRGSTSKYPFTLSMSL